MKRPLRVQVTDEGFVLAVDASRQELLDVWGLEAAVQWEVRRRR